MGGGVPEARKVRIFCFVSHNFPHVNENYMWEGGRSLEVNVKWDKMAAKQPWHRKAVRGVGVGVPPRLRFACFALPVIISHSS